MSATPKQRLTPHQERAVAVKAMVDPRTVRKYFAGKAGRGMTQQRIEQALRELDLVDVASGSKRTARKE